MAAIFLSGFSGTSSGAVPGTAAMATSPAAAAVPGGSTALTWWDHQAAVATITAALAANPCQPIIIVGHSLGGDTAVEVCDLLRAVGVCVDLLVQIESVGAFDDVLPANARSGVNIFAAGLTVPKGETSVLGSTNVGVGGTNHTAIDDNPTTSPTTVGAAITPGPYLGMNAWQIVAAAIAAIPGPPWCNCRCPAAAAAASGSTGVLVPGGAGGAPVPHHLAPPLDDASRKIRDEMIKHLELHHTAMPFGKLVHTMGVAPEKAVGPLRSLLADGTLHEVPGKTEEIWVALGPPALTTPETCQRKTP